MLDNELLCRVEETLLGEGVAGERRDHEGRISAVAGLKEELTQVGTKGKNMIFLLLVIGGFLLLKELFFVVLEGRIQLY